MEQYWHEFGQIDLVSYTQNGLLYRGVHFANSTTMYNGQDLRLDEVNQTAESVNQFHLFGVEWNQTELRFFFDQTYSERFRFTGGKGG